MTAFPSRHRILAVLLVALAQALTAASLSAAPDPEQRMIDKRFGSNGRSWAAMDAPGGDMRDDGYAAGEQSDGRVVVAGTVALPGGRTGVGVARFTREGQADVAFGSFGRFMLDLGGSNASGGLAVAIQSDDRIVVAGWISGPAHQGENFLVLRLEPNGSLDTSFGLSGRTAVSFDHGGNMNDWATAMAIQPDGKIVVVGNVQRGGVNDRDIGVLRLNPSGGADTSFGTNGKTTIVIDRGGGDDAQATGMDLQSDGKILIGGWVSTASNGRDMMALRLLADGSRDTGFGPGSDGLVQINLALSACPDDEAADIKAVSWTQLVPNPATQRRVLLAGSTCLNNNNGNDDWDFAVVRLTDNGAMDTSFNGEGYRSLPIDLGGANRDIATSLITVRLSSLLPGLFPPSHILVGGYAHDTRTPGDRGFQMAFRMMAWSGSNNDAFGPNGRGYVDFDLGANNDDYVNDLIMTSNGTVVAAGTVRRATGNDHDFAATRIVIDRIYAGDQEND